MPILRFLWGASAVALAVALQSADAVAQQTLPTIDVGGQRARPIQHVGPYGSGGRGGGGQQQAASGPRIASSGVGSGDPGPTGLAAAKPLPENNTTYRPENSVSALKTNTPIMDTPASIQVVPRAVLNDKQATSLSQAVNTVSGVISADERQGLVQTTWIRGFLTNVYYLDGVRMPSNLTTTTQNMANVDRVEILKGPASILYGRGEPGGLINLVTKQPLEKPYHAIQQQVGSWGDYRTTLDSTAPITADKSLLYRVNIAYENWHDFIDFSHGQQIFVAPKVTWRPDEHTQFNVFMIYQNRGAPFTSGPPAFTGPGPNSTDPLYPLLFGTGGAPIANLPRSRNFAQPWARIGSQEYIAGFNWSRDLNENWTLKHKFQAQVSDAKTLFGGPFGYNDFDRAFGVDSSYFKIDNWAINTPHIGTQSYFNNFDLTGKFNTGDIEHTLLVGTDYQYFRQAGNQTFAYPESFTPDFNGFVPPTQGFLPIYSPFPTFPFNPSTRVDFAFHESWLGAYVQDQVKLPYNLHLLAGARFDDVNFYDDVNKQTVTDKKKVTPRFGLLWRPIPEVSLYGSYLTNFGNAPLTARRPVQPESAQQWEVGVKTELLDKRLTATLAYYDIVKQNVAAVDPTDPSGLSYITLGGVRNKGVELDVAGEIVPGWRVIGGYSYISSIVTKDQTCTNADNVYAANPDQPLPSAGCIFDFYNTSVLGNPWLLSLEGFKGKRLPGAPTHSGSIWSTYEFPDGDLKGFKFGGGVTARSLSYGDNFNSFHLPGYATVALMAAYESKVMGRKVTFQVNVNNLLDTRYYSITNPGVFAVLTGTPRSVMGSIKVEF